MDILALVAGLLIGSGATALVMAFCFWPREKPERLLAKPGQEIDLYDPADPHILRARLVIESLTFERLSGTTVTLVDRAKFLEDRRIPRIAIWGDTKENDHGS